VQSFIIFIIVSCLKDHFLVQPIPKTLRFWEGCISEDFFSTTKIYRLTACTDDGTGSDLAAEALVWVLMPASCQAGVGQASMW
jgi:hypothetical protein